MTDTGRDVAIKGLSLIMVLPLATLLRAWALTTLWIWFVTPLGPAPLHPAHALGLATLFSLLTASYSPSEKPEYWGRVMFAIVSSPIAVLFGWIYKAFMP